ncbi:hypothetical protein BT69DRAFT_1346015 [Atractiella rhizophila]|nr:hypothetical protein BT69DRAFT_1346015 [Atractiella rhizophila]
MSTKPEEQHMEMGEDGKAPEKEKKKRNRISASCSTCRKKKLRCDRGYPCGSCASRNDVCVWDGLAVPTVQRSTGDIVELRNQVDRLQQVVDSLVQVTQSALSQLTATVAARNAAPPAPSPAATITPGALGTRPYAANHINGHLTPLRQESEKIDLVSADLAQALGHLAVSQVAGSVRVETVPSNSALLAEAMNLVDAGKRPSQSSMGSHAFRSVFPFSETATMAQLLKVFPNAEQATSAVTFYLRALDWYLHPIHLPTMREQWLKLYQDINEGREPDALFLATFFAICGMGLAQMPMDRAAKDGFGLDKGELANKWLEASAHALAIGKFLDRPNIEAIRAIILLNSYSTFISHGENGGKGMGLLSLGVQIAHQLELHRDPDNFPGRFNPVEAEDRRKLFWSLFTMDVYASSALGRRWSLFNLDTIDTKFPQDLEDDELTTTGINHNVSLSNADNRTMTSLIIRMKIAVIAKKITDKAFGIKPVSYSTVLQLDSELSEIELPPIYRLAWDGVEIRDQPALTGEAQILALRRYMIHLSLAQERLRLHRPFLVTGLSNKDTSYSRKTCITSARIILALQRSPSFVFWASAGIVFKSLTAAIALSLEILQNPDSADADVHRQEVQTAMRLIELYVDESTIARKGTKVLNWLVAKDQERLQKRGVANPKKYPDQKPANKRPRTQTADDDAHSNTESSGLSSPPSDTTSPPAFTSNRFNQNPASSSTAKMPATSTVSSNLFGGVRAPERQSSAGLAHNRFGGGSIWSGMNMMIGQNAEIDSAFTRKISATEWQKSTPAQMETNNRLAGSTNVFDSPSPFRADSYSFTNVPPISGAGIGPSRLNTSNLPSTDAIPTTTTDPSKPLTSSPNTFMGVNVADFGESPIFNLHPPTPVVTTPSDHNRNLSNASASGATYGPFGGTFVSDDATMFNFGGELDDVNAGLDGMDWSKMFPQLTMEELQAFQFDNFQVQPGEQEGLNQASSV